MSPLHRAARRYAEQGIPVFPCAPGTKRPLNDTGFHGATTDPDTIDSWWSEAPDANVAFSPHSMGWGVVDLDGAEGLAAWEGAELAEGGAPTRTVRTPRGGEHRYYLGELPTSVKGRWSLLPNLPVDTRGNGSYALLPPSVTEDGAYALTNDIEPALLPAWVAQWAEEKKTNRRVLGGSDTDPDIPVNVARAKVYLTKQAPPPEEGSRDQTCYRVACMLRDLGISAELSADLMEELYLPRGDAPDRPIADIVASAWRNGRNDEGVFALRGANSEIFGEAVKALSQAPLKDAKRSRFHFANETEQDASSDPDWLVPGLIPDCASVMLFGPTQFYKSFVAVDIALSVAAGIPTFAGMPVRSGPVFYCAGEGRHGIAKKRRPAWKLVRGVAEVPSFYVGPTPLVADADACEEFRERIRDTLKGRRAALIVLDTLAKTMIGLNENDARDAGLLMRFVDELVEEFQCPVLVLHHTGKDTERGERGSSAFRAGFDSVVEVKAHREARLLQIKVAKHKDADEPETPWHLRGVKILESLVFSAMTSEDYRVETEPEAFYARKKVHAALTGLNATSGATATSTYFVARAMNPKRPDEDHGEYEKRLASSERVLSRLARGELSGYATGRATDLRWSVLPEA